MCSPSIYSCGSSERELQGEGPREGTAPRACGPSRRHPRPGPRPGRGRHIRMSQCISFLPDIRVSIRDQGVQPMGHVCVGRRSLEPGESGTRLTEQLRFGATSRRNGSSRDPKWSPFGATTPARGQAPAPARGEAWRTHTYGSHECMHACLGYVRPCRLCACEATQPGMPQNRSVRALDAVEWPDPPHRST